METRSVRSKNEVCAKGGRSVNLGSPRLPDLATVKRVLTRNWLSGKYLNVSKSLCVFP